MKDRSITPLYSMLLDLRSKLAMSGHRIVLAESCTCGLAAAFMGQIPGISEYLCGSMVVYRTATKSAWLEIEPTLLAAPDIGPVSGEVTEQLLIRILESTPEATLAAAITGHLGPGAPPEMDGWIFCGFLRRSKSGGPAEAAHIQRFQLQGPEPRDLSDLQGRGARQREAAESLLRWIVDHL